MDQNPTVAPIHTKCNICRCILNDAAEIKALNGGCYACCPETFVFPPDPSLKIYPPLQNCENCGNWEEMYGEDGCMECCLVAKRFVPRSDDFNWEMFRAIRSLVAQEIKLDGNVLAAKPR